MVTHLEPDILECEVKWDLRSITTNRASRGDGIPAELFQILKDDALKVSHSVCQQIWKTQQWPQDWKRSVCILIPKKNNAKECSNYQTTTLISQLVRLWSKAFKPGFSSAGAENFQMFKLDLEKAEDQTVSICWIIRENKGISEKHLLLHWTMRKTFTPWITTNCGKFLKRWEYQTT